MTDCAPSPILTLMRRLGRLLRTPAFHFALVGLALFVADRWWTLREEAALRDPRNRPIVIDESRVARIRRDFQRRYGSAPSPAEEVALLDQEIDEEVLYREALVRGLENADRSIQWWLIKKMRFVAEDPDLNEEELYRQAKELGLDDDDVVIRRILAQKMRLVAELAEGSVDPDPDELAAYFEEHGEDWRRPARVSLRHVFLSRDRRGDALTDDATALLAELASQGPEAGELVGDPFPLGRTHRSRSQEQLAKLFGPGFASAVMDLEPGGWRGPVPSAYGEHLVYVEEALPSEPAQLESVHNQVSRRLAAEKRAAVLARELSRMRGQYEIRIERPEDGDPARAS